MGSLLVASVCILTIGLAATTRTENVTVGGYYPGVIVSVATPGGVREGCAMSGLVAGRVCPQRHPCPLPGPVWVVAADQLVLTGAWSRGGRGCRDQP